MRQRILHHLEKNSRLTAADLAVALGADEKEIMAEIAAMEADHVICGYHTLINWDKIAEDHTTALIEVRVTPQKKSGFDSMAEMIYSYPEVRSCYLISGSYDIMVIVEGHSIRDVSGFVSKSLSTIDGIVGTATHFILKKYKDHGTVFDVPDTDERIPVTL